MIKLNWVGILSILTLSLVSSGCEAIGDIFGAGVYTGIFLVIFVIVLIIVVVYRIFKR
ncbi:MAG TPA: hypothetical protein VD884_09385 [Ohtaekwangia sp.]|nr:hypothetical protein [Ohtaekwangia sp.]